MITVAFLITEWFYSSDGVVCGEPHILLAWFVSVRIQPVTFYIQFC